MAGKEASELCVIDLKEEVLSTIETPGSEAYSTFQEVISGLKAAPGLKRILWGYKVENAGQAVAVLNWDAYASYEAFRASPAHAEWHAKFQSLLTGVAAYHFEPNSVAARDAILDSPCVEVVTAYGTEPDFVDRIASFAAEVNADPPADYFGAAYGPVVEEISKEKGGEKGPAVTLIVGWKDRAAHLAARSIEGGVIIKNIGSIRSGRKDMDLYHVHLKDI